MIIDQMRYSLEVAYCKNFSAAQNLYISQQNLTRYRVELTEYSEQLLIRAETLFMPFLYAYSVKNNQIICDRIKNPPSR